MELKLHSISKFITITIFLGILKCQNVTPKSIEHPYTSTPPSTTTTPPPFTFVLDERFNPEIEWDLFSNAKPIRFVVNENSSDYRIAVHLKQCDFEKWSYIDLEGLEADTNSKFSRSWGCNDETYIRYTDFGKEKYFDSLGLHKSLHVKIDYLDDVPEAIDGIKEVLITPHLSSGHRNDKRQSQNDTEEGEGIETKKYKNHIFATIVINIYRDINKNNACEKDEFNCYEEICPTKCCSEHTTSNTGSSRSSEIDSESTMSPKSFLKYISSDGGAGKSRCIPRKLKCNSNPNCGVQKNNADEMGGTCHPDSFCEPCQMCLTWNYVLTSLAIAVLFIITPTAIVFALFHRRNVALERQRLIRLANARMADLRGEFTREAPINDNPPTYDEVYDIKVPPPCFCQAIAMEMGMDAEQFHEIMQSGNSNDQNTTTNPLSSDSGFPGGGAGGGDGSNVGVQNLAFKCSCQSIDESGGGDVPPRYASLNNTSNGNSNDTEGVINEDADADKSTDL